VGATVILLVGCDAGGCAFVPCDGEGYGVWVTNQSDSEAFVRFGDSGPTYRVAPRAVDGRGPWIDVSNGRVAMVSVWDSQCALIDSMPLEPGEYRLTIEDGGLALSSEDVMNNAGQDLEVAAASCVSN
jgi:hypothetical protein